MAARTFVLIDVDLFKKEGYFLPQQQNFIYENEGHQEISLELQLNNIDEYLIYKCHYDKKVRKKIKVSYETFYDLYYEPSDFNLYYNENNKIIFIGANTDLAQAFIKELNNSNYYKLNHSNFDLKDIINQIDMVNGLWVGKIKEMNLKSVGFYGENVNRSKRAQDTLNDKGTEISSFIATYYSSELGREISLLFSKKGSITIFDSLSSDHEYVLLLNEIFEKFLKRKVVQ